MHKKSLSFYTATCALFFSYFNVTYTSSASDLTPQTRSTLENLINLPHQYRHALELIDTPTHELNAFSTRAKAEQYDRDMQHMMESGAYLDHLQKERSQIKKNLLKSYNDSLYRAAKAAEILEADKQQRVNIEHEKWMRQDNHNWDKLQNQANMLHKVVNAHNALQGQNKEKHSLNQFSSTRRVSQQQNPSSLTKEKEPLTKPNIKKVLQPIGEKTEEKASSTPSKTKLPEISEAHENLPLKSAVENKVTTETEKVSELRQSQENTVFSDDTLDFEKEKLTPQIAHYLVMPHALLFTGFSDLNNQSALLDTLRITMFEPKNQQERDAFLSTYGNRITLSSFLSAAQKNYNADISYTAVQTSMTLMALENENSSTNFGLFGTYGKLAFAPKNKENTPEKKIVDKWSLTAYGHIQYDGGVYASAFLFYGIFQDNSDIPLIEKIQKVHNTRTLGASATVGQKLEIGLFEGVTFEPQAQLVYQRLIFGLRSEDEDFKVNMGYPHQWWLRLGTRLTRNTGNTTSFYGKLNFIKTFEDNHSIEIGKRFQLSSMGSSIEGGLGVHSYLLPNIALHGDVSYQYKLKESIISGMHFSAGIRYKF